MPGENNFHSRWNRSTDCFASTAAATTEFTTGRVISCCCPTTRSLQSPDHIPCDLWLWGYLKTRVYFGDVPDLATLMDNISRVVRDILSDKLVSAVNRMQYLVQKTAALLNLNRMYKLRVILSQYWFCFFKLSFQLPSATYLPRYDFPNCFFSLNPSSSFLFKRSTKFRFILAMLFR